MPLPCVRLSIVLVAAFRATLVLGIGQVADEPVEAMRFDVLGINEGLSQGLVSSVAQDTSGFLWLTSKDGLNRYDGYRFTTFRHHPGDSTSLSDNNVQTVMVDSRGRLWAGLQNRRVELFDPRKERFMHFRADSVRDMDHIISDHWQVFAVEEDPAGNIWVDLEGQGMVIITDRRPAHELMAPGAAPPRMLKARDVLPELEWELDRHKLLFDRHGGLWILGSDHIAVYDVDLNTWAAKLRFRRTFERSHGLMFRDPRSDDMIWMRLTTTEVLDARTGATKERIDALPGLRYNGFCTSDDGKRLLFSMFPPMLMIADGSERSPYPAEPHAIGEIGRMYADLTSHLIDRSGTHWMGTSGYGVLRRTRTQQAFQLVKGREGNAMSMHYLAEDLGGRVLFSGPEVEWLDPGTWERRSAHVRDRLTRRGFTEMSPARVQGRDGRYWLSCLIGSRCHLYTWDPRTDALMDHGSYDGPLIWQFQPLFQAPDSSIWYGTTLGGQHMVCRLNEEDPLNSTCYRFDLPYRHHGIQFISSHHFSGDGAIWLGTCEGVFRLDPASGEWLRYHHRDGDSTSLASDMVFSLCPDPDEPERFLWVGTNGAGMDRLDMATGVCTHHGTAQGIPNMVIYGIQSDAHGHLWLSTNQGLCQFDPDQGARRVFTDRDGLQSNEFNRYASCRTRSGRLFFGGVVGFNHFDPEEFHSVSAPSPVRFTEVRVMNRRVGIGDGPDALLDVAPQYASLLTLDHTARMVTFRFACLDLTNPASNRFRYRLKGFDREWVDNGTANEVTFTNLDAGSYVLEVQGMNSAGVWNTNGARLSLVLLPPWWATWWFRGAVALLLGFVAYRAYRGRMKALKMDREVARLETQALRSQMNPHFIFNALNSINAVIRRSDMDRASGFVTRFARVMRGVLEHSRHGEVSLREDLGTLQAYLELERQRCDERFDFEITVAPDIDPDDVMVPPLVVQPFVENAIWHGMAGKVDKGHIRLHVQRRDDHITYTIEDDGAGRHAPKVAADPEAPVKKTSLGTTITRERLDLVQRQHGGKAGFAYEDLNPGTRVTVTMPELKAR
ncbi:MAG TPA: histidine kinase [Flavobacteriales bacterium]|nr:histidine kinase [Flavobacteriales bacterium]HMR29062.1 histidine kinase [Flavobacteriales bacterium]